MYPLLLKPIIKNYIWGGERLINEYGYESEKTPAAEAWCLSCREGNECIVLNGEYAGLPLGDVPFVDKKNFPLLVKLIDAKRDLSIQIHPGAECAARHAGDEEKSEMWYVIDCEEGSHVILGFNEEFEKERKNMAPEAFCRGIKEKIDKEKLLDVCRRVEVHPGDVVFVEPGTLHAICRGIFLAEVQQNSDTTYRVYDYGRLGADGRPRELHIDRALAALTCAPSERPERLDETVQTNFGTVRRLALGKVVTSVVSLSGTMDLAHDEPRHLLVLSGDGAVAWDGGTFDVRKGDSVFLPQGLSCSVSGGAEILLSEV